MDVNGNLFFTRKDGGCNSAVIYQRKRKGYTWTPGSAQGTSYNLNGQGSVAGSTSVTTTSTSSGSSSSGSSTNSGTSVANMTIGTQTGATSAIDTIDAALNYVQAEGQSRCYPKQTDIYCDNLTNAMTNAASAKKPRTGPELCKETAEWQGPRLFSRRNCYVGSSESATANSVGITSVAGLLKLI